MKRSLVTLIWLTAACRWAAATPQDPIVVRTGTSTEGGLKDTITVVAQGLSAYLAGQSVQSPKFVLYLNGIALQGLQASAPIAGHDHITFYLDRIDANRAAWALLFQDPVPTRQVSLSIGLEGGHAFNTQVWNFGLVLFRIGWLVAWGALILVLLVLFLWMARASDIIRESGPPPAQGQNGVTPRKAFSLGLAQKQLHRLGEMV